MLNIMILADKIVKLRRQNNLSQEELAEQLGISRQSVSKWENGTSIPDLDKIIRLSNIFGVSTDYLLKDEVEEIIPADIDTDYVEGEGKRRVSLEEVTEYLDVVAGTASKTGIGVVLCILGPAILIFMLSLTVSSRTVGILTEQAASGLGVAILLLFCAAGVILLINNGMKTSRFQYFETSELNSDYGIKGIVEKKKAEFEPVYRKCITAGVAACILSVVPLMVAGGMGATDRVYLWCTSLLLVIIAGAVYLFIWSGTINGSYDKVLQIGDYTPENKRLNRKTTWFSGTYWCFCVAVYLFISFTFDNWDRSWIVWPVAGVLFAALHQIVRNHARKEIER